MPQTGPGRPRNQATDAAILDAALDLLIERGVEAFSIDQVARCAGVTRATVYRRFPDKTQLLIAAIHAAHGGDRAPPQMPECRDVEHMLALWAIALADPRRRRLLRRLTNMRQDHPELAEVYWSASVKPREQAIVGVLQRARERGRFPPDADLDVLRQILTAAAGAHLANYPDSSTAAEIEAHLLSVLRHTCYRSCP